VCRGVAPRQRDGGCGRGRNFAPTDAVDPLLSSRSVYSVRLDGGFAHPELLDFLDASRASSMWWRCQKRGVEAQGQTSDAPSRKLSRRSGKTEHIYREANYAAKRGRKSAASSSKPRSCKLTAKSQGQSALRHHQPEADPAVDLRNGLLSARRDREPDQGCAGETGEE